MSLLQRMLPQSRIARLGIPAIILAILAMIVLPLPPFILDVLFTFNIAMSVLILLVSVSARNPLDFALFPTVILVATLMRLTLNVASTRVVLLHGHTGDSAAGRVIEAFGQVVVGGSFAVGLVVFVILTIVNFVVITKGAERISEVTARFTLDALPGKQMAIDADLNAGLLGQKEAKQRRQQIAKEADFYGAMDGASKFVRGDAIAGILILIINLIGGFLIGILGHDLGAADAFRQYALLSIGDGLVAQIPALLLATAAAIIVTRVNESSDITDEFRQQVLAQPGALYTVAGVLAVMGLVPGMPHLPFLGFAALLAFAGWRVSRTMPPSRADAEELDEELQEALTKDGSEELNWEDIPLVERLSVALGYKLVNLVNEASGAPLTHRVRGVRQTLSERLGFLIPQIHIRDSLRLKPAQYNIYINGEKIEGAEIYPDRLMAIPSPELYGEIDGVLDNDPAYGMHVVWINSEDKPKALNLGYQVVDCASVIATHINKTIREHLTEIFEHDDVEQLQERLAAQAPKLAEALKEQVSVTVQHRVYRHLLQEEVPLRDIVTIGSTLLQSSEVTKDPILLASDVRFALRRTIVSRVVGERRDFGVFMLEPTLENTLMNALSVAQQAGQVSLDNIPVEPSLLNQLQTAMPVAKEQLRKEGHPPILAVMPQLRPLLARYARVFSPGLHVLSQNEIPEKMNVSVVGTLG